MVGSNERFKKQAMGYLLQRVKDLRDVVGESVDKMEERLGSTESRCWEGGCGYNGEDGKFERQTRRSEEGGGEGKSGWWGDGVGVQETEAQQHDGGVGVNGTGGFDDTPGGCDQCVHPWGWDGVAKAAYNDGGHGSDDNARGSIQEVVHITVANSDKDRDLERNDCKSTDNPGWFHTAVYGLEGLNRLRGSPDKGKGNGTTSQQRRYSATRTIVCGVCGRDKLVVHDLRYNIVLATLRVV